MALSCIGSRWLHFMGDSHSRNLFDGLAFFLGCRTGAFAAAAFRYDSVQGCDAMTSRGANVTYLFRNKMMRQLTPRAGHTAEDDLHNEFLHECHRKQRWPDVLIYSVGAHEVLASLAFQPLLVVISSPCDDPTASLTGVHMGQRRAA